MDAVQFSDCSFVVGQSYKASDLSSLHQQYDELDRLVYVHPEDWYTFSYFYFDFKSACYVFAEFGFFKLCTSARN